MLTHGRSFEQLKLLLNAKLTETDEELKNFEFIPKCQYLWRSPIIHWNGDILGCNTGNIFSHGNDDFHNILLRMNSHSLMETRKILLGELPLETISRENPCYYCPNDIMSNKIIFSLAKKYIQAHYTGMSILESKDISMLHLEFSTECQLNCPACWRIASYERYLPRGNLTPKNLKVLLEDSGLDHLKKICIQRNGEGLLNPYFAELLHMLYDHGIEISNNIGYNFNHITDEQIEAIVDTKMQIINIPIDGASQKNYSRYKIGGNFDRVIENIKRLQAYKQKVGSEYPIIYCNMTVFNWNIHEIDIVNKIAKELNVKFNICINCYTHLTDFNLTPKNQKIFEELEKKR